MSAKVHIHMHVSDLDKSREFYRAFFGAEPVKEKPGYTKFLPEWGPVNLALSQGGGPGAGPVDHLGIQVESTTEVMTQLSRIKAAGLAVASLTVAGLGLVGTLVMAFLVIETLRPD